VKGSRRRRGSGRLGGGLGMEKLQGGGKKRGEAGAERKGQPSTESKKSYNQDSWAVKFFAN